MLVTAGQRDRFDCRRERALLAPSHETCASLARRVRRHGDDSPCNQQNGEDLPATRGQCSISFQVLFPQFCAVLLHAALRNVDRPLEATETALALE